MAAKTKTGFIPSLRIDRAFLESLGKIIESEVKERNNIAEKNIEERVDQEVKKINEKNYYNSDAERQQDIAHKKTLVRENLTPFLKISYTIDAVGETLTFDSIDEVLDTNFFPSSIESLACNVHHYGSEGKKYVNVRVRLSTRWYGLISEYELSSSDTARLLKIDDLLRSLFSVHQTDYKVVLYPVPKFGYLVPRILSGFLALSVAYLTFQGTSELHNLYPESIVVSLWFELLLVYNVAMSATKFLFPYFEYRIGKGNSWQQLGRKAFVATGVSILGSAGYDFIKSLFL